MTQEDILEIFQQKGALLSGHFLLTSGLHSSKYLQCALVLQYPDVAEVIGKQLAAKFAGEKIGVVAAPALGGVIVAHEVARALSCRAIFTERQDGRMTLRRGFSINPGERVLVVEDVVTTGGSTLETIDAITAAGGTVIGAGSIINRSGADPDIGVPYHALVTISVPTYKPDECPLCKQGEPAIKPGSRGSRQ